MKALVELEKRIFMAVRAHDANTLDGILAADFVYVSPRKPDLRKPEFLREVGSSAHEIEWLGAEEMKIHIYGDMAVVTGVQHAKVRLPKGGIQSGDTAFTDVFRKSNGEWWLVLAFGVDIPTAPEGK